MSAWPPSWVPITGRPRLIPSATVAPSGSGQSEGMTPNIALSQAAITAALGTSVRTTASGGKSAGESRS